MTARPTRPIVLDTDAVVDVLRGRAAVVSRLSALSPADVGVTSMTVAELLYGAFASTKPDANRAEVTRFLSEVHVLPFGRRAAAIHAELRWRLRKSPIGPADLIVASTVLAAEAALVTANTREFARIEELQLENWRA